VLAPGISQVGDHFKCWTLECPSCKSLLEERRGRNVLLARSRAEISIGRQRSISDYTNSFRTTPEIYDITTSTLRKRRSANCVASHTTRDPAANEDRDPALIGPGQWSAVRLRHTTRRRNTCQDCRVKRLYAGRKLLQDLQDFRVRRPRSIESVQASLASRPPSYRRLRGFQSSGLDTASE